MKVVMHRVEKLINVGPWPTEGSSDCYSKQVKWVIKFQTYLQKIIDLADTNDELAAIIYNREKLAQILKLFPAFMEDKMSEFLVISQRNLSRSLVSWMTSN